MTIKYTHRDSLKKTFNMYLDNCLKNMSNGPTYHTYSNGLAGTLVGLKHLQNIGMINIDMKEFESQIESYLVNKMIVDLDSDNYDFLHGAIGVGIYLQKAFPQKSYHNLIISYLDNHRIQDSDNSFKWPSSIMKGNTNEMETVYNISLSHGMSSIAVYLSRLIATGNNSRRITDLLSGTVNFILDQEIDSKQYGSFFPPVSKEFSVSASRMGWCYGDLSVAMSVFQAGLVTENNNWKQKALEVLNFATGRRDLQNGAVHDAGLCHGSAGIAQIFRRAYLLTGEKKFRECSYYWIDVTINYAMFKDGLAGYKSRRGEEPFWVCEYGMLTGIAGIGLALLSSIANRRYSRWDEILLI